MKILDIALRDHTNPQPSLEKALRKWAGKDSEYMQLDWMYERGKGDDNLHKKIIQVSQDFSPEITFMQLQTKGIVTPQIAGQMKGKLISWSGDVRMPLEQHYVDLGKVIDMTFFASNTHVKILRDQGIKSEFLNIGFDNEIMTPQGSTITNSHEIVFMGSNYGNNMFPLSQQRRDMVNMLREKYGARFKCYGSGWNFPARHIDKPNEAAVYRSCKIAINQNHFNDLERWSSDRILRIMGSGAMCLSNYYYGIEKDFTDGKHLKVWADFEVLTELIDYYLEADKERQLIATEGCLEVHKNHRWDCRVEEMKKYLK